MENAIQSTTDYGQFKIMDANREVARGHVENLKKAFDTVGDLTKSQPILVNEKHEIIDGQHRFVACQELGLPINYTVVPGLNVTDARTLNVVNKNWGPMDYARSYALTGNASYERYLRLREDYPITHMTAIYLAANDVTGQSNGVNAVFKKGDFRLTAADDVKIRRKLDRLTEIAEYVPHAYTKITSLSFLRVMEADGYSHAKMLRKMQQYGDRVRKLSAPLDSLREIEDIYNMSARNRVRLF